MNQRRRGGGQERTPNQQISDQQRAQAALNQLMRDIAAKRRDIEAVLPADIPFEKFQACLNMAIRREPKLLDCTGPSLIRAAIMSAYDGLLPDGREAVIVCRAMSYKLQNGSWAKDKRLEASYMPMAFGLRKKIVAAGAARHIKATCVYQNDFFEWEEGLNERLEHKPLLAGEEAVDAGEEDPRGPLRAVYSIAILPDGSKVFEVMPRREVMKVKAKAQTKDVWEGPFEAEMWKKSVLRRHSKALPTATPIRDAEAQIMFPDWNQQPALPARTGTAPGVPTRDQFAQLGHEVELPLDLSGFGGEGERVDREGSGGVDETAGAGAKGAATGGEHVQRTDAEDSQPGPRDEGGSAEPDGSGQAEASGSGLARPTDQAGWDGWKRQLLIEIGKARKPSDLDELQTREAGNIEAAPQRERSAVEGAIVDKRIDLQGEPE